MHKDKIPNATERMTKLFPRLFYFCPTMPPHRIKIGDTEVSISEPMDCILWLMQTLAQEHPNKYCLQDQLEDLVAWFYPPKPGRKAPYNFSKQINALDDGGFIQVGRYEANKRIHRLELTPAGERLLQEIQKERLRTAELCLSALPAEDVAAILSVLERLSVVTWTIMKREARASARALIGKKRNTPP